MARKVTPENLGSAIAEILKEYGDQVEEMSDNVVRSVAKKGRTAVKNSAASVIGSGRYASSWSVEIEKKRYGTTATIYSKVPGLPHLLEHGHAIPTGGRVAGRPHIAPVAEELETEFPKMMEEALSR